MTETDHSQGNSGPGKGHGDKNAHILIDTKEKTVRAGDWLVSDLKQTVGVDAAKALAEITPSGLIDLADTAHIDIHDGMRFMSHVRSGGSS